jgi:hypothetical protein
MRHLQLGCVEALDRGFKDPETRAANAVAHRDPRRLSGSAGLKYAVMA